MSWTTPDELKAQVRKLWDRGMLLTGLVDGEPVFPRRLTLTAPTSRDLSERFSEVRDWIACLSAAAGSYRLEWRQVNHRVLGPNRLPSAVWVDSLDDALGLIGKRRVADAFVALLAQTRERQPELVPWLANRPLVALPLREDWSTLLSVVAWVRAHPRAGVYLRQMELPGVHTKWIERHRGVLAELLDLVLPSDAIDASHTGTGGFCRRYGFLDKPQRVRFRLLDPAIRLLDVDADQDITLTKAAFAGLDLPSVARVFITENEINFLAFPPVPGAMAIFGAGYGFDNLATAAWLRQEAIYYWGDIDTHGFAILNQLRAGFPRVESLLMDRQTLLDHRPLWGVETKPETAVLARLTAGESALYEQLRQNHWGDRVRLEQERIGFDHLRTALRQL